MTAADELRRLNRETPDLGAELGPNVTTESMRCAALYPELERRLETGRVADLVVLGAGRHGLRSPQVQELSALVHARASEGPARLTVVDMDARVLEAVRAGLDYDFETLSWREFPGGAFKTSMEAKLRRLDADRAASRLRFELATFRGDLRQMDFGDGLADAVVSTFALCYVLPKEAAAATEVLGRVVRALRPGGAFFLDSSAAVDGPLFFYDAARLEGLGRALGDAVGGPVTVRPIEPGREVFVFERLS